MEVHLVFPKPGQGLQGGLVGPGFELFIGNQTAQSWLPGAWLGVSHPTKQALHNHEYHHTSYLTDDLHVPRGALPTRW
jgi:hypothetical protein